jgi:hypothetical protein
MLGRARNGDLMRVFGILGVVVVLCAGFFVYQRSMADVSEEGSPQERIDTTAIRQRLLTIAQTERQYQASNGKYATLEQLADDNLLPGGTEQRGYTFTASITSSGFTITAAPTADDKEDWPTLEITETMQVTER